MLSQVFGVHDAPEREQAHGYFTDAVRKSLRDAATDHDRDGAIQLSELIDEVIVR